MDALELWEERERRKNRTEFGDQIYDEDGPVPGCFWSPPATPSDDL